MLVIYDVSIKAWLRTSEGDNSSASELKVDGGARLRKCYKARYDEQGETETCLANDEHAHALSGIRGHIYVVDLQLHSGKKGNMKKKLISSHQDVIGLNGFDE